ncbi:MAG: Rpn family recombination-promoting nuclease/putative transposase [Lachnospiraceae bacterium]|nr:Rpn family recombination-promoting nuclease/putative transposase [Lachnospiraceae bacterium]
MPCHFAAENGEQDKKSCSPFSVDSLYGKIGFTGAVVIGSLCGGAAPAPPTSPKEQKISFHPLTIFVLDLKVLLNDNELINIEMQITNYLDWPDRSIGYLSREFDQLNRGSAYSNVLPVHQIGILNFTLFPECPEFYATNKIMNVRNHHIYSDKFTLSVLDLTQIHIAIEEDISHQLDYWAKLFLAKTWEDIKMLAEKNETIKEAAATMYVMSADEKIRMQCEARERYEYEQKAAIGCGLKLGEEKGFKKGLEKGHDEERDHFASLANRLKADHRDDEIITAATDPQYCEKLYKEYQL